MPATPLPHVREYWQRYDVDQASWDDDHIRPAMLRAMERHLRELAAADGYVLPQELNHATDDSGPMLAVAVFAQGLRDPDAAAQLLSDGAGR